MLHSASANLTFETGSTNYRPSTLKDHKQTDGHKRAEKDTEHKKAKATGSELPPRKLFQDPPPTDSAIAQGLHKMGETNIRHLVSSTIFYQITPKGLPFTHFKGEIKLQKLHYIKFKSGAYKYESACCDFIVSISDFLMDKNIIEDLLKVNFFALLFDGSTDHSNFEQEVVYVAYCNPKNI